MMSMSDRDFDLVLAIGRAALMTDVALSTRTDIVGYQDLADATDAATMAAHLTPARTLDGLVWKLNSIARQLRGWNAPAWAVDQIEACIGDAARLARPPFQDVPRQNL